MFPHYYNSSIQEDPVFQPIIYMCTYHSIKLTSLPVRGHNHSFLDCVWWLAGKRNRRMVLSGQP